MSEKGRELLKTGEEGFSSTQDTMALSAEPHLFFKPISIVTGVILMVKKVQIRKFLRLSW